MKFNLPRLKMVFQRAAEACLTLRPGRETPLRNLEIVEAAVVSDACIAGLHRRFMGLEGPTDVLTFDHGEIVIGAGTASANAALHGKALEEELALYIIHGLLHLHGFDDKEPADAAEMARTQESILRAVWPGGMGPGMKNETV